MLAKFQKEEDVFGQLYSNFRLHYSMRLVWSYLILHIKKILKFFFLMGIWAERTDCSMANPFLDPSMYMSLQWMIAMYHAIIKAECDMSSRYSQAQYVKLIGDFAIILFTAI